MLDSKFFKIGSILIVLLAVFFMIKRSKDRVKSLQKNAYLSVGQIVDRVPANDKNSTGASGVSFWYTYKFKNKQYKDASLPYVFTNRIDYTSHFVNKTFPIVIDSTHPEKSELLLSKRRFAMFNLTFPDSLKWVEDHLR